MKSLESSVRVRQSHGRKQAEPITRGDSGRFSKSSVLGVYDERAPYRHAMRHLRLVGHCTWRSRRRFCVWSSVLRSLCPVDETPEHCTWDVCRCEWGVERYGRTLRSVRENCTVAFFGVSEEPSAKYLEKTVGTTGFGQAFCRGLSELFRPRNMHVGSVFFRRVPQVAVGADDTCEMLRACDPLPRAEANASRHLGHMWRRQISRFRVVRRTGEQVAM